MTKVFVYGTLKRGGSNHRVLAGQRLLGPARTLPGYTLYALGDYPGMVPAPDDTQGVSGEVWAVAAPTLRQLDELEGVDEGLYVRAPVPLHPPFAGVTVEAYLYRRDFSGHRAIGSEWP